MNPADKTSGVTRRNVLAGAAAAGFAFLPSRVLGRAGALAPSEKLNVAFVGIGTRGSFDLREMANLQHNVVALCDVDWRPLEGREYPTAIEIAALFDRLNPSGRNWPGNFVNFVTGSGVGLFSMRSDRKTFMCI